MTTCPQCHTRYSQSGEPNCWCSSGDTQAKRDHDDRTSKYRAAMRYRNFDAQDLDTIPATRPSRDLPHSATTTQQLADLVDVVANLELRLMTSTPGVEQIRTKRKAEEVAPVNVAILHALDDRTKYGADDMPAYLADEQWTCQHYSHHEADCPHENDDAGRQGVLPDLWTWARMIEADLMQTDPKLPEELPDPATMATVCSWLIDHHERWTDLFGQEADEFTKDVRRWHTRLRAELGEHDPPILRHGGVGGCGDELAQMADGVRYECRGCHEVYTLPQMMSLAKWHSAVTLAEAHTMTKVPLSTLKHWAKAGRIEPTTHHRPRLYWLRDITHEAGKRGA